MAIKPKEPPFAPTEKQLEKRIKELYRDAWQDTRTVLAKMYEQYSADGILTMAEMTKYNRLAKIEQELALILKDLYSYNKKYVYESMESAYLNGYFETQYQLEMGTQRLLGFGGVNEAAIKAMLSESLTGLVLDERLGNNLRQAVNELRQSLSYTLLQGYSYPKAARYIQETLGKDQARATLVAWTETHRAYETASHERKEQAKANGLEFKTKWLATLDKRTRSSHRSMDGRAQGDDGYFTLPSGAKGRFPGDPMLGAREVIRCRCTTVTEFANDIPSQRRGRTDYEDAKSESALFPDSMTYKQWYESRNGG